MPDGCAHADCQMIAHACVHAGMYPYPGAFPGAPGMPMDPSQMMGYPGFPMGMPGQPWPGQQQQQQQPKQGQGDNAS